MPTSSGMPSWRRLTRRASRATVRPSRVRLVKSVEPLRLITAVCQAPVSTVSASGLSVTLTRAPPPACGRPGLPERPTAARRLPKVRRRRRASPGSWPTANPLPEARSRPTSANRQARWPGARPGWERGRRRPSLSTRPVRGRCRGGRACPWFRCWSLPVLRRRST